MTANPSGQLIPISLGTIAVMALVAAGLLIYDGRHEFGVNPDPAPAGIGTSPTPTAPFAVAADLPPTHDAVVDDEKIPHWSNIDWEKLADHRQWEVLQPRDAGDASMTAEMNGPDSPAPAGTRQARRRQGQLVVVTNFTKAQVTVNGEPYRAYDDQGRNSGMALVANEPHQVVVVFNGNQRIYDITVAPGERRLLMVELTGMGQGSAQASPPPQRPQQRPDRGRSANDDDQELDDDQGEITVYSRPRGSIVVGGSDTGERTPGTVDVEPGRHQVQVRYDGGELSETKTVRVRGGSRIKLFFRDED